MSEEKKKKCECGSTSHTSAEHKKRDMAKKLPKEKEEDEFTSKDKKKEKEQEGIKKRNDPRKDQDWED